MDYIVNYISDLLASFLMNTGSLQSSASAFPTTLTGAGTSTTEIGSAIINDDNSGTLMQTAGTATTSTGTGVSLNAEQTYHKMMYNEHISQAYVESLNEEELSTLIAKVENKEINNSEENKVMKLN